MSCNVTLMAVIIPVFKCGEEIICTYIFIYKSGFFSTSISTNLKKI